MWGDCNAVTNKRCCIGRVVLWEVKCVWGRDRKKGEREQAWMLTQMELTYWEGRKGEERGRRGGGEGGG